MKVSNNLNSDISHTLYVRIREVLIKAEADFPDVNQREIALALMENLGEVILNIDCPDCRRLNKKMIEKMVPVILRDAMKEATQYQQASIQHVH